MFQFLVTNNSNSVINNAITILQDRFNNMSYFVSNGTQYVPIYLKDLVNLIGTQYQYDFTTQLIINFINTNFDIDSYLKANKYIVSNTYVDNLQFSLLDFIEDSIYSLMVEFIENIFNGSTHINHEYYSYKDLDLNKELSKFAMNGYLQISSDNTTTYLIQQTDE